jgi:hypothetical protein
MKPRFIIFVETLAGEIVEAFAWTRDQQSGVERARKDAKEFGVQASRVWAEPINIKGE